MPASGQSGSVAEVVAGGVPLDTSGNTQIPILMDMVAALSRAEYPQEVLKVFAEGMTKLYGPRGYVSLSTRGLEPGEYKITRLITEKLAVPPCSVVTRPETGATMIPALSKSSRLVSANCCPSRAA